MFKKYLGLWGFKSTLAVSFRPAVVAHCNGLEMKRRVAAVAGPA